MKQRLGLILPLALVFLATFFLYSPTQSFDFVNLDDPTLLIENEMIRGLSFEKIGNMFVTWEMGNWVPLTYLTMALQYSLWELNPSFFHLFNNTLHSINVCLTGIVCYQLLLLLHTKIKGDIRYKLYLSSCIAALIYGLHPLRVESVAWVIELKDLQFFFFYLLSILSYIQYLKNLSTDAAKGHFFLHSPVYWLSLLFFVCSGFSKPMAVSLPITLLLIDWVSNRQWSWLLLREKIPFIGFACVVSIMTLIATYGISGGLLWAGLEIRTINAVAGYGFYLEKTILPLNLAPLYYYEAHRQSFFWLIYSSALAVSILFGMAFLIGNKFIRASLYFYIISLFPVIGINQAGLQSVADRFSYLPTIIIFLWLSYFIFLGFTRYFTSSGRVLFSIMIFGVLLLEFNVTRRQLEIWKNAETLWLHQVAVQPHPASYAMVISFYSHNDLTKSFEYSIKAYQKFPHQIEFLEYATMLALHNNMPELAKSLNSEVISKKPFSITGLRILYLIEMNPQTKQKYYQKMLKLDKNILIEYPHPLDGLMQTL